MNPFLYDVAEDLIRRYGDDLKDIALVFNNKRPVVFLKKYLAEISKRPLFSPQFFTIQQFIAESSGQVQVDFLVRFFILHEAYNELLAKEKKNSVSTDDFLPMAEIILRDFDQIDLDLVAPDAIYSYLKDVALIEKQFPLLTEDQQIFLSQFWSSFSTDKQVHIQEKFIELWSRLPQLYQLFHQKLKERNLIGIATAYRDLAEGKAQNASFTNHYKKLVFIGFNALNKAETKVFKAWQAEDKALFYFDADKYYMDDEIQEAGLFLRKNIHENRLINALGDFPALIKEGLQKVDIFPVLGHIVQAKVLQKILKESVYKSSKIAVILADESLLIPVLQTLPNELKINITMGFPLTQSPLYGFLEIWLEVQERLALSQSHLLLKEHVLSFLAHPLSGLTEIERKAQMTILGNWRADEIPANEIILSNSFSKEFFKKHESGLEMIATLEELVAYLYEWRLETEKLQLIEGSLLLRLEKVLNLLRNSLKEYGPKTSQVLTVAFIRKVIIGIAAPIEGEPLDGIQVMGMLESRCLDFDEVIVLGANEGVLPQLSLSPTFIPDSLRRAFGLPVLENQDALSAYLFYRLVQRTKKITVVYNSLVDGDSTGEPSRFLQQLKFESDLSIRTFPQKQLIEINTPTLPFKVEKTAEIIERLNAYLDPEGKMLSASGLLTYLKCPLEFFFKYIAGFKEPDKGLDALDLGAIGSMVHEVLESFYQEFLQNKAMIRKEDILLKMDAVPQLCKLALIDFLHLNKNENMQFTSSQLIALSIIEENVNIILKHDAKQVAPFRLIELENKEDYRCAFPVEINGIEKTINLYAIIDRIDEVKGQKRIVDYKTGGDKLEFKEINICTSKGVDLNRAAFQSLLYSLIYEQVSGNQEVQPHLYILRQLHEGSLLKMDKEYLENEALSQAKVSFKQALNLLLTELFDPDIPFQHNEDSLYCKEGIYSQFCHPSGLINTEEEDIEIE